MLLANNKIQFIPMNIIPTEIKNNRPNKVSQRYLYLTIICVIG